MKQRKILIADDESHIVYVVSLKLRGAGFDVATAMDGEEALEIAIREKPDCIITDLQMPKMNGIELRARLQEIPDLALVPVILLTAKGFEIGPAGGNGNSHRQNKQGNASAKGLFYQIMSKPFSPRELLACIQKAIAFYDQQKAAATGPDENAASVVSSAPGQQEGM